MWTTRYVMREIPLVVDEIEHYQTNFGADNIDFYDLTAIIKKSWIIEFCHEIKRRDLKFSWQLPSGTRSEAMDAQVMYEMASSGCMNVTHAPESGSPRVLKEIKKKVVLPRLFESISEAKKNGIFVKCNLIVGFPRETRRGMLQSVWCAVRFAFLGVDDTAIYPFSPYPSTELYDYLRKTGAIPELGRPYFESLMTYVDLQQHSNYCENVAPVQISLYRVVGMSLFYSISYLLHPSRLLRTMRNYRANKSDTVFEERLFGLLRRKRLEKDMVAA
jgi:anaerobic magnesium-protoporphyrin IX monomethyl ester cyclase